MSEQQKQTLMMKAVSQLVYGPPQEVLEVRDHPKPSIKKQDTVLIKVKTTSVQGDDYHLLAGYPKMIRLDSGLKKPKQQIVGLDFAGVIEEVGSKVNDWKVGDEVIGWGPGSMAEYIVVSEKSLVAKPASMSWDQAGVIPMAGLTAYQSVVAAKVKEGDSLLIEGASGGVGTYAIQFAKARGVVVTAVCSEKNFELVKSLGADHCIDYKTTDWTDGEDKYDAVIELVAAKKLGHSRRALKKKGRLVMTGGNGWGTFGPLGRWIRAMTTSLFVSQSMKPMIHSDSREDLAAIVKLMEEGKVRSVVTRSYPYTEIKEAEGSFAGGHCTGMIAITMD